MSLFVVEHRFTGHDDACLDARARHRAYLETLRDRGELLAAGPFADDSGALGIYPASSGAELRRVLNSDPSLTTGACLGRTVRRWEPSIGPEWLRTLE